MSNHNRYEPNTNGFDRPSNECRFSSNLAKLIFKQKKVHTVSLKTLHLSRPKTNVYLRNLVLSFESQGEIFQCGHSNEGY